jgi:hypothetical protein
MDALKLYLSGLTTRKQLQASLLLLQLLPQPPLLLLQDTLMQYCVDRKSN